MGESLRLLQYAFHHIVGALPQLRSFNGVGHTIYAIVVPPAPGEVTLSGPALAADGTEEWPKEASIAAKDFFQKYAKGGRKCSVTALLVINVAGVWHCTAINIPVAERLGCDESTPLHCANSVLDDLLGSS